MKAAKYARRRDVTCVDDMVLVIACWTCRSLRGKLKVRQSKGQKVKEVKGAMPQSSQKSFKLRVNFLDHSTAIGLHL
jgi:hypothetical protein